MESFPMQDDKSCFEIHEVIGTAPVMNSTLLTYIKRQLVPTFNSFENSLVERWYLMNVE